MEGLDKGVSMKINDLKIHIGDRSSSPRRGHPFFRLATYRRDLRFADGDGIATREGAIVKVSGGSSPPPNRQGENLLSEVFPLRYSFDSLESLISGGSDSVFRVLLLLLDHQSGSCNQQTGHPNAGSHDGAALSTAFVMHPVREQARVAPANSSASFPESAFFIFLSTFLKNFKI